MKEVEKYFKKRKGAINSFLKKDPTEYTTETFHKLRVEIKKLDALYDLIAFGSKKFRKTDNFKPLKKIFKKAGKVREIQVEEAVLKKHLNGNSLNDYRDNLRKRRSKEKQYFFSLVDDSFLKELKKQYQNVKPHLSKIKEKKVENFSRIKKNKIRKLILKKNLATSTMHKFRKRLKKYNYIQKCLHQKKQLRSIKNTDTLSKLLGKWHDDQIISTHLQKAINSPGLNQKEIKQLKKTRTKIAADEKLLFQRIKETLRESEFSGDYLS